MKNVQVNQIVFGKGQPLNFILGPCVMESRDHVLFMAEKIKTIFRTIPNQLVFKSSFDKANRTAIDSFRGLGIDEGLKVLQEVKERFDLNVITDIHEPEQAAIAAEVVDILQIPAFLCRQTDLVVAAAKTGKTVNIKKAQYLAPMDMVHVVRKVEACGNENILLTERGTSFGYGGLVTDFRAIPMMQQTGYPVIFDATHSAQVPGGKTTGGMREFIPLMARAAIAAGCNGIFMETHDDVVRAKSDKETQFPLDRLEKLVFHLIDLYNKIQDLDRE
ncbi:MAG: 3-deoxy-8-phosphooctulonate synthase [Candidatus Marinimicrobia bacterium]|nr:3-deoxy-8-phosphooctulonate synthase [Candidatus Neomarinimicrobiota bacterium]